MRFRSKLESEEVGGVLGKEDESGGAEVELLVKERRSLYIFFRKERSKAIYKSTGLSAGR